MGTNTDATATLHEEVVARLREMLIEGVIPPGARIPERDLCRLFAISRTPLREALKVLAAEGHVELLRNRGARVARLTSRDLRELLEVCAGLEAIAGELACQRVSDAALARIEALHAEMAAHHRSHDLPRYYQCNRQIHEAIVRAAGNAALAAMYDAVNARIRRARYLAPMPPAHWDLAMREHEGIMNALVRRDGAGLAHILRRHLDNKFKEIELAGFAESEAAASSPARRTEPGQANGRRHVAR
ncbi:MAG: GntR family transcriptional regulator [Alphaproteobacteria bacterium]|nr:GntR family transcriptional regulator [Alphaproteobacteria bacterium]